MIAAGRPARGLDGFRTSHDEALRALQTRRTLGVPAASVVAFADVEVVSLLQADSAAAEAFARRTLAPLGDELVTTLRALHGEGMSVSSPPADSASTSIRSDPASVGSSTSPARPTPVPSGSERPSPWTLEQHRSIARTSPS